MVTRLWFLLAPIAAMACKSSPPKLTDITGLYRMSLHTKSDSGCDGGAPVSGPEYFRITSGKLMGGMLPAAKDPMYMVALCSTAEETSCEPPLSFGHSFVPEVMLFRYPSGRYVEGNPSCRAGNPGHLFFTQGELEATAHGVRLELEEHGEESPSACEKEPTEAVGARGPSMACETNEVIEGTKL